MSNDFQVEHLSIKIFTIWQDLFFLGLWSHCSCLSKDLPCLEAFPSRVLHLCTFHLKVHSPFMAKDPKEYGIQPWLLRKTHELNSCRVTTQKFGFLLLCYHLSWSSRKHSCGFPLNLIPFHLSFWTPRNVPLMSHRYAVALTLKPLGLFDIPDYNICLSLSDSVTFTI